MQRYNAFFFLARAKYSVNYTYMKYRKPFVAGRFYPNEKEKILEFIENNKSINIKGSKAIALIVPHAGYVFSGKTALMLFEKAVLPKNIFILSPNHTGYGNLISIDDNEKWKTPLGYINVNTKASKYLAKNAQTASLDTDAQLFEHAIEVQIPFIQYFNSEASIIPITVAETDIVKLENFASTLYDCVKKIGLEDSMIVCSSDMTHFEDAQIAEKKDELAINDILALDGAKLYNTVKTNNISMCGVYPATVLLFLLAKLRSELSITPSLVHYTNSGEVTGDYKEVVAYAGISFQY